MVKTNKKKTKQNRRNKKKKQKKSKTSLIHLCLPVAALRAVELAEHLKGNIKERKSKEETVKRRYEFDNDMRKEKKKKIAKC